MKEKEIELEQYEVCNSNNYSNFYSNDNLFNLSNESKISKSKFAENFHFLCKNCKSIPKLNFTEKKK